jgi:hypothetical protein
MGRFQGAGDLARMLPRQRRAANKGKPLAKNLRSHGRDDRFNPCRALRNATFILPAHGITLSNWRAIRSKILVFKAGKMTAHSNPLGLVWSFFAQPLRAPAFLGVTNTCSSERQPKTKDPLERGLSVFHNRTVRRTRPC